MPVYSAHLRDIIREGIDSKQGRQKPLSGFKVAVDAGNGSGGFLATDVLAELGADTSGRLSFTAARASWSFRNVRISKLLATNQPFQTARCKRTLTRSGADHCITCSKV